MTMRLKRAFQRLSISQKYMIIYISLFAIPIIVYARMTFMIAERGQMDAFYKDNTEKMAEIHSQLLQKVAVCDRTAQLALSNNGFITFVSSNMTEDAHQLVNFKYGEYQEMQNIININPSIYNITFFINNPEIYEMWPLLLHRDKFPYPHDIEKIYKLDGMRTYAYDNSEKRPAMLMKEDTRRINLYRKIHLVDGFIEVSMLLVDFFESTLWHQSDTTSYYLIKDGQPIIVDENNAFFKKRLSLMPIISKASTAQSKGDHGKIELRVNQETFYLLYRYMEPLDAYIYQISSIDSMMTILDKTGYSITVAVIIAIGVLIVITSIVTLLLTNKIRLLRASIRRVESGDLNVIIPVTGSDEVDEVAKHFNHMVVKIRDLIDKLIAKEVAVKDIEIKALQSQINSHFLHNVLESIRILAVLENNQEIAAATGSLGKLMRYSMNWEKQLATIKEEITLVESYIHLINLISDGTIVFKYQVENKLLDVKLSKMLIQPIVENAIKHGIQSIKKNGEVALHVITNPQKSSLQIVIMDDGKGMDEEELQNIRQYIVDVKGDKPTEEQHAIGLRNVDERIKYLYGEAYGITIVSEKSKGTKVTLSLPYKDSVGGW